MDRSSNDWAPAASWPTLRRRAALLAQLRTFFDARGFLEVETPLLSAEVLVERHLDPLSAVLFDDPREPAWGRRLWLQTSPEAHMKRLLAAGGEAIYQVTRSFRGGERGRLHNPEFTIVEWYRCGDSLAAGMELLSEFCQALLGTAAADLLTYADAFRRHAGLDPHAAETADLAAAAVSSGLALPDGVRATDRDELLNVLLAELVEPHLGRDRPAILYHYPASQAAVAQVVAQEASSVGTAGPSVAERFELYYRGVELANGYHELTDPEELRRRMDRANDQRHADGKSILPPAMRLIEAQQVGLPNCTGVALGFDRLVMLDQAAKTLDEVIPFPIDRA